MEFLKIMYLTLVKNASVALIAFEMKSKLWIMGPDIFVTQVYFFNFVPCHSYPNFYIQIHWSLFSSSNTSTSFLPQSICTWWFFMESSLMVIFAWFHLFSDRGNHYLPGYSIIPVLFLSPLLARITIEIAF